MHNSSYSVGDQVMFRNRCQRSIGGMTIAKVDASPLFGDHWYQLTDDLPGVWWTANNFISFSEWQQRHQAKS